MSRRTARENAFKIVYEAEVCNEFNDLTIDELRSELSSEDAKYYNAVVDGVKDMRPRLEEIIRLYAKDFEFSRLYKVDIAILLVAIYEILFMDDIPLKVSVNEAVELAKLYSTEKSASYVNGILASVLKNADSLKQ